MHATGGSEITRGSNSRRFCFFLYFFLLENNAKNEGGAVHHRGLVKNSNGGIGKESGSTTPSSSSNDEERASRSRSGSDDVGNDGVERNAAAPNDALHLERRVSSHRVINNIAVPPAKWEMKQKKQIITQVIKAKYAAVMRSTSNLLSASKNREGWKWKERMEIDVA